MSLQAPAPTLPTAIIFDLYGTLLDVEIFDLEHFFFDRAIDLSGTPNAQTPQEVDAIGNEVETRTRHRTLSAQAIRRTRRAFLPIDDKRHPFVLAFFAGWMAAYRRAQERRGAIAKYLSDRIYRTPYLIIGTQSYRRAMARIDIQDIDSRIAEDAQAAFERLY
jgi:FMN phosphatase YigB (HAD superfamily)